MKKFLIVAALFAAAAAQAEMPAQKTEAIAWGAGTATFTVPNWHNGRLLSIQALGVTNAATLAVSHLSEYETGLVATNAVETAAAAATLHTYPADYSAAGETFAAPVISYYVTDSTNVVTVTNTVTFTASASAKQPVWLAPGDRLVCTLSATNTSAYIVIKYAIGNK